MRYDCKLPPTLNFSLSGGGGGGGGEETLQPFTVAARSGVRRLQRKMDVDHKFMPSMLLVFPPMPSGFPVP